MQKDSTAGNTRTEPTKEIGVPAGQALYQSIFEQIPIAVIVYDTGLRIIDCNQATARLFGASRPDIIGLHVDDLRDQRLRAALEGAIAGQTASHESPYHSTISDAWHWGAATFAPLRSNNGQALGVIVLWSDRTAQVEADSSARSSEFLLGEAQRLGRVGSWTYDVSRGQGEASPEFFRILGLHSEKLLEPGDLERFIHPDDRWPWHEHIAKVLGVLKPFTICEFRIIRPDGATRSVIMRAEVKYADDGVPVAAWGTMQDITERRVLEEQLRRAQRMEALGQLAGGVAHDFNNLLTVIQVETGFLQEGLSDNDPLKVEVFEIRRAAERAASLTRQLLAFSRKQILRPRLLDLNTLVSDTSHMLRRLIGEDIELVTMLTLNVATIMADPGQLEQVLVNLAVNARDAMPTGGVLRVETSAINVGPDDVLVPPGDYVVLTVSDTGHGMDENVRLRIFDPFFTTKPPGRGTGLGLSTVFGIVEQSGGKIAVESTPGRGATFTIYLPRANPDDARPESGSAPLQDFLPRRHATVLLVEDEQPLRSVSQRVLEREGYTVLTAEDGFEGLAIAETFSGTIDLLITDVVLPGLDGRAVAARLKLRRPGLQVLYMTGYTDDEMLRRGLIDDEVNLLDKPFNSAQLADAARRAIRRATRGSREAS
jgi:two-component system cell cycle sensor histidine kinase/response regulator CckA